MTGQWIRYVAPKPDATRRLFLFPHAGGSAANYNRWAAVLPTATELALVELPGRMSRRAEPSYHDATELVDALHEAVEAEWDGRPFAFFGHSMGGLLAYRLTVAMEREGGPSPALLGVSAWAPILHRAPQIDVAALSDDEFVRRVRALGALPAGIADDPEMLALVLPSLRGDFSVVTGYRDDGAAVACPVAAYGGRQDPMVSPDQLNTWLDRAPTFLGTSIFPGSHFYLNDYAAAIAADLARQLR
jgi:surfactin synthase thioesterase subunit